MKLSRFMMVVCVALSLQSQPALSQDDDDPTPTTIWGGEVFKERCALCHGTYGEGRGLLPSSMEGYPDTSLLKSGIATDNDSLRKAIIWGGSQGRMSPLSPPWGDELTWSEIESVLLFMQVVYEDEKLARSILDGHNEETALPTFEAGRAVFGSRCNLCHGEYGEGDGKLSRIIKNPPPFNLTLSGVPEDYTLKIILEGGEALGRSKQMPPWKDELSEEEVRSVLAYVMSLRKY